MLFYDTMLDIVSLQKVKVSLFFGKQGIGQGYQKQKVYKFFSVLDMASVR